ncbi:hypothetical protein BC827DRAFT_1378031 [Russula dissimulans]|nr:hypothetical protein BC827DRAFT_1378031 [Russula dissimulans]
MNHNPISLSTSGPRALGWRNVNLNWFLGRHDLPPNLAAVCPSAATGDLGDELEEGDEREEPEVEEEGEEPADDGDGDVVQESDLDESSSPSVSLPLAQTMPSRSSRLKITLKLPSQTQKPPHAPHTVHKDSDIEPEDYDEDDHTHGRDGKRPLTTCQAVLASVVGSSPLTFRWKKQLNKGEIALRREETARKRKHLSEKKLEDKKAETINRLLKK